MLVLQGSGFGSDDGASTSALVCHGHACFGMTYLISGAACALGCVSMISVGVASRKRYKALYGDKGV